MAEVANKQLRRAGQNKPTNRDVNREANRNTNRSSNHIANKTPNNVANKTPNNVANKTPNNVANKTPNNVANKTPNNVGNKTPNNVGNKTPNNVGNNRTPNHIENKTSNYTENKTTNETTSNVVNNISNKSPNETVNHVASETISKATNDTTSKATNETTNNVTNETISNVTNENRSNATNKTTSKATNETISNATNKTTSKATNETISNATSKTTNKSLNEGTNNAINETTSKSLNEGTNNAINETTSKSLNEGTNNAANKTTSKSLNEGTNNAANKTTSKSLNEGTNNAANKTTSKTTDETTIKATKEGTSKDANETSNQRSNLKRGSFVSRDGLELKTYEWVVSNPCGIIILVHALNSHVRFEYLKLNAKIESNEKATLIDADNYYLYEGSWIERLNKEGYSVYGLDMRGHGESECVLNVKTHVNEFKDLINDVLQYINIVHDSLYTDEEKHSSGGNTASTSNVNKNHNERSNKAENTISTKAKKNNSENNNLPFYLMGLSMGGNIVLRILELREKTDDENIKKLNIKGVVSLAGMISLDDLKKKTEYKYFYIPISKIASTLLPTMRLSPVLKFEKFPYINDLFSFDKNCCPKPVTNRFGCELLKAVDALQKDIKFIPEDVHILIIHSVLDSACSYAGVSTFFNKIKSENKELFTIDDMDHILPLEPGNERLLNKIIDWLSNMGMKKKHISCA
ncbi:lysophospholipase [Plasmodium gonderi]|uniref:Lysophospholipase n=1 Tax=Plasmodium gonderi TaxID=77519 RepID=A0A1Y1JER7_PLAGO|nr:lysophospholipase [Plasmodium gonderi]GAW78933.1 lysophospholipase [Plasmodium gonderi]